MRRLSIFCTLALALVLGGCSAPGKMLDNLLGKSDVQSPVDMAGVDDGEPVGVMYNKALDAMKGGSYKTAALGFAEVERRYPYSGLATRAILMQAYAEYQRNAYDDAINACQRFIALHPGNKDVSYAYYLIALSRYEQIADIKRDQTDTREALAALEEVVKRFPGTAYASDAAAKIILARDHLAGKEMEIGRYYMKKHAYLAAINRFKTVVVTYQTTSQTPEALYRLTEAYMALGIRSEAQMAAAVLGQNYPQSSWYHDAYAFLQNDGLLPEQSSTSWLSGVFKMPFQDN